MDLTRVQLETLLDISPDDLDKIIIEKNLPHYHLSGEKRFDLLEIESWMMEHHFWEGSSKQLPYNLYRALARGGFVRADSLEGGDILKWGSSLLSEKLGADPEGLYALLASREALASTAIGDGYALPHPRERQDAFKHDILYILHLDTPLDFNAFDKKKVHTFFFLISGSDKSHLPLISKIAHLVHSHKVLEWIKQDSSHKFLLSQLLDWEKQLLQSTTI